MKKNLSILLLALFAPVISMTQDFKGTVYDLNSHKPIQNAEVIVANTNKGATTNKEGKFRIKNIGTQKFQLKIQHIQYKTFSQTITLPGKTKQEFYLVPLNYYQLQEVVISDTQDISLPYLKYKVTENLLDNNITRDIGEYIKTVPNVSGIKKGGTSIDPVIRGFKFKQVGVVIDNGIRIEGGCPNRMDPALSHIDPDDIKTMEIFKGPYALRYGAYPGGMIKISTTQPKMYDEFNIQLKAKKGYESNWNGNSEYASITGGNKFLFFNLSGGKKDYNNYQAGNGNLYQTAFRKYGYTAKAGIQPLKGHIFSFSYNGSYGRNVYYPSLPMDEKTDDTRIMSADYKGKNISGIIDEITLNSYYTEVDHLMVNHFRPISDTVMAESFIEARNMGYRAEILMQFQEDERLYFGTDLEAITKDGSREKNFIRQLHSPVKEEALWIESYIENYGIFAEYHTNLLGMKWVASVRGDYNTAHSKDTLHILGLSGEDIFAEYNSEFTNYNMSIGVEKKLNKNYTARFSAGKATRNPSMLERYIKLLPIGYDKYDYLGNPQLEPETNYQADLTFTYKHEKTGQLTLNGFYALVDNYIKSGVLPPSVILPNTPGVLGVKQFINAEDWVELKGFELSYYSPSQHRLSGYFSAAYTHGIDYHAYNTSTKTYQKDALPEIPPLEATAHIKCGFLNRTIIPSASMRAAMKHFNVSETFAEKETPGFAVIDAKITYHYNKMLVLNAGVNNIFDHAYYEHLTRNIIGSKRMFYEPGRSLFVNAVLKM